MNRNFINYESSLKNYTIELEKSFILLLYLYNFEKNIFVAT